MFSAARSLPLLNRQQIRSSTSGGNRIERSFRECGQIGVIRIVGMKARRHAKILELISSRPIDTQDELLNLLSESGFPVTQATISRDIKELRLIKTIIEKASLCFTSFALRIRPRPGPSFCGAGSPVPARSVRPASP